MKTHNLPVNFPEFILGVKLSDKIKQAINEGKETDLIKGFQYNNQPPFDAYLSINSENKLIFRISNLAGNNTSNYMNSPDVFSLADIALEFGFWVDSILVNPEILVFDYLPMIDQFGNRIIIHRDLLEGEFKFFALDSSGVSGNVAKFLEFFSSNTADQNKKFLAKFQNQESRSHFSFIPTEHILEKAFMAIYGLKVLETRSLFYEKEIKDSTLDHSFFRGLFLSFKPNKEALLNEEPAIFLVRSKGNLFRADTFNDKNKLSTLFHGKNKGIWYSNIINREKVRRLVVVSHPLEALCYHQLYSKPSDLFTVYAAVLGNKNDEQIEELQYLIDFCKPENVIISTKNNITGLIWANALLGGLYEPRKFMESNNTLHEIGSDLEFKIDLLNNRSNKFVVLSADLTYNETEKGVLMNENLFKYFDQINVKELKDHPELENASPFVLGKRLISKHKSKAHIYFALKLDYLQIINKVIQHLRPILFLKLELPEHGEFERSLKLYNEEKLNFKENKSRKAG